MPTVNFHASPTVGNIRLANRMNHAQFIRDIWKMLPELGHPVSRGTHLPETPERFHDVGPVRELDLSLLERKGFVMILVEARLIVEQINVRRPPVHEEKNDPLGPGLEMRLFRGKGRVNHSTQPRRRDCARQQSLQSNSSESETHLLEERASGKCLPTQ